MGERETQMHKEGGREERSQFGVKKGDDFLKNEPFELIGGRVLKWRLEYCFYCRLLKGKAVRHEGFYVSVPAQNTEVWKRALEKGIFCHSMLFLLFLFLFFCFIFVFVCLILVLLSLFLQQQKGQLTAGFGRKRYQIRMQKSPQSISRRIFVICTTLTTQNSVQWTRPSLQHHELFEVCKELKCRNWGGWSRNKNRRRRSRGS